MRPSSTEGTTMGASVKSAPTRRRREGRSPRGLAWRALAGTLAVAGTAGFVAVPLAGGAAGASQAPTRAVSRTTTDTAPSFTSGSSVTLTTGGPRTVTITASGSPSPAITMTGGALPPGMEFSGGAATGSATITGTPSPTQATYTVDLTAANSAGTATQQLEVTFSNFSSPSSSSPAPPSFTTPSSVKLTANQYATVHIAANGSPTPTISAAGGWPPGMSFSASPGTGTATISGVPHPTSSTYTVTLTAANGQAPSATQHLVLSFSIPPAFTSPSTVHLSPNAYGTVKITTTGSPTPTLHEYGNLPPGMYFHTESNGTATISGYARPGSNTTYDVTVTAENGVGSPATQHLVLSFASSVSFTSPSTLDLKPNQYNNLTITTKGTPTPQLRLQGQLPPGLRFRANANGTATIYGYLPQTSQTSWPVTVTASNGQGPAAVQHLELVVPEPVSFTSPTSQALKPGSYDTVQVTTKGSPTPKLTESGTLPPGMVFRPDNTNGTATIDGYVQPGVSGTYRVTITASNGVSPAVSQQLVLTFSEAPAITTPGQLTVKDGTYAKFTIRATGTPTPTMSEQGNLPAGLHFYAGRGIAVIAGTAHFGLSGTSTIEVIAANGAGPNATQQLRITTIQVAPPTNPRGNGYWYVTSTGQVVWKGQARPIAPRHPQHPRQIVDMATTPDGLGYWLVSSYGGVFPYGNAPFYGSIAHLHLHAPTIAIASTPSGHGYYEVTRAGNVYTYGDARFYGSTAGRGLPPIAAFALTPDGHGYWLVSIHGNIYRFGDARFLGSPARMRIPTVTAFAPTPDGNGYYVVTRTGDVLTYGDAVSYGSLARRRVPPVTGFATTKDGHGYWIVTSQGNVFNYGDARFLGSSAHVRLPGGVEGFAPLF